MVAPVRVMRARFLVCLALESGLIMSVLYGLALLNLPYASPMSPVNVPLTVVLMAMLFLSILAATQSATLGARASLIRELLVFSVVSFLAGCLLFASLWLTSSDLTWLPTMLALQAAIAVPACVSVWRWISVRFDVLDVQRERVLIVGAGQTAKELCRWIGENHAHEYSVVGFADETNASVGQLLSMGARIQTDFDSLARYASSRADRVIVALDEKRGRMPVKELMEIRLLGMEVEDATSFLERVSGRIAVETMLPSWLIFSDGFRTSRLRTFLKRSVDLSHALLLLVLSAPIMLLTAILIKIDSRGPILYRQARLSRYGEEFHVLKFRSMRQDAEKGSGPTWAQADDPRVTRVGGVIRKLRIDELPQLINVLRGEMSFVGPRPERAFFVEQLEQKIPYFGLRMTVRPGLTGWAQVEYGYGSSDDDALEKLKYDLFYIKNHNILLDLWIILKTVRVVISGHGAR